MIHPLVLLACPSLQSPILPPPAGTMDQRLADLKKAKDWGGLADAVESLPGSERLKRLGDLLEGLQRSGRWVRLLEVSSGLLADPPKGMQGLTMIAFLKGRALSELGRHSEALAWYREIGKQGDVSANLEACYEASCLGDWNAQLAIADLLLARNPANGTFLATKGEALARLARYAEAEPVLEKAVTAMPGRAMAWADLACCRNEQGHYLEAYEAASRALYLDPKSLEGACNRGRACLGLKRYPEARADLAAALAMGPKDPALVENLKTEIAAADKYLAYMAKHAGKPAGAIR